MGPLFSCLWKAVMAPTQWHATQIQLLPSTVDVFSLIIAAWMVQKDGEDALSALTGFPYLCSHIWSGLLKYSSCTHHLQTARTFLHVY